jgi:hypothetical protein
MNWLATLASLAGIEVDELLARLRRNAVAFSIVGILGLLGIVFLLVALNAALTLYIGPVWAPLAIAGGALFIALCVFVGIRIADAAAARREAERRKAAERTALATSAVLTALPMVMRLEIVRKLGIPLGGALAVAYLLAHGSRSADSEGKAEDASDDEA